MLMLGSHIDKSKLKNKKRNATDIKAGYLKVDKLPKNERLETVVFNPKRNKKEIIKLKQICFDCGKPATYGIRHRRMCCGYWAIACDECAKKFGWIQS